LQRGDRLQQRVHRPAEDARLLPGHHRDGVGVGQPRRGGARGRRRAAVLLLRAQHLDQARAIARLLLRACHGLAPRVRLERGAGVEPFDLLEVVGVVAGQRTDPREAAHVHRAEFQPRFAGQAGLDRHGVVLSQSAWKAVKAAAWGHPASDAQEGAGDPAIRGTVGRSARGVPSLTREDPSAFSPPAAFGPFRVLHQIGIGTLGPVFRTYEPARDRLVAVKVFRLDIVPEQAQALADALKRAAQASLFHPPIVEPLAAGVEGTLAYRAEEYVAAESLDVAMRHYAPAPLDNALPVVTQHAGAIDFARAAGVGHGGLHPRDVFVTPDEARATGF